MDENFFPPADNFRFDFYFLSAWNLSTNKIPHHKASFNFFSS